MNYPEHGTLRETLAEEIVQLRQRLVSISRSR